MTVSHSQPTSALALKMSRQRVEDYRAENAALKARITELEGALRAIDTHLDNFGYLPNMKARKLARNALSHAGPVARDGERK